MAVSERAGLWVLLFVCLFFRTFQIIYNETKIVHLSQHIASLLDIYTFFVHFGKLVHECSLQIRRYSEIDPSSRVSGGEGNYSAVC